MSEAIKEYVVIDGNQETYTIVINDSPDTNTILTSEDAVNILVEGEEETLVVESSDVEFVTEVNIGVRGYTGDPGPVGPAGPPGTEITKCILEKTAISSIGEHRVVFVNSTGKVSMAYMPDVQGGYKVLGISTQSYTAGQLAKILTFGELSNPLWNWSVGTPIYCGPDGTLLQAPLESWQGAAFELVVGIPTSPTSLFVRIGTPRIL